MLFASSLRHSTTGPRSTMLDRRLAAAVWGLLAQSTVAGAVEGLANCSQLPGPVDVRLAGTLSLTGRLAGEGRDALRGLQVLAVAISQNPGPELRTADGRCLNVTLDIHDDGSDEAEVRRLYSELARDSAALLVGPVTSALSLAAASTVGALGRVLLQHAPAVATVENYPMAFTVGANASLCFEAGLRVLKAKGLRTLAVAWAERPSEAGTSALCEGAVAEAKRLGFQVLAERAFAQTKTLAESLQAVARLQPEALVACGCLADAIDITLSLQALGFKPKAMLVSEATPAFIQYLSAATANYMLSPTRWHALAGGNRTCAAFGSAQGFAEAFIQRFSVEPSEHAAAAAAAGLALLAAVAATAPGVLSEEALRRALTRLHLESFFGPLRFLQGSLEAAACGVQQTLPLPRSAAPVGRYTRSNRRALYDTELPPEPTFYLLPQVAGSPPRYEPCDPPEVCLGANNCLGENEGVLCAQCRTGFTSQQVTISGNNTGKCGPCPALHSLLLSLALFCIFSAGCIALMVRMTLASCAPTLAIHSIIVKSFVNYLHLAAVTLEASELSVRKVPFVGLMIDATLQPFLALIRIDCLVEKRLRAPLPGIVGLLLVPLVLVCTVAFFSIVMHVRVSCAKRGLDARPGQLPAAAAPGAPEGRNRPLRMLSGPLRAPHWLYRRYVPKYSTAAQATQWLAARETVEQGSHFFIVSLFVMYPVVVKMLLEGLTCRELDIVRLKRDLDVECKVGTSLSLMSFAGLFLYAVGVPLAIYMSLRQVQGSLLSYETRRMCGFLYNGFEPRCCYFEAVYMLRKSTLLVFAVIPILHVRLVAMLSASFLFLAVHIRCKPHDHRDYFVLGKLESASLMAVIATSGLKLFWIIRGELEEGDFRRVISGPIIDDALVTACSVMHAFVWWFALWGLLHNSVLRHLEFKAECLKDDLTLVQRLLLRLVPRSNMVQFEPETHRLLISKLSSCEQDFLFRTMCDVLELYSRSGAPQHPGLLVTALRMAIEDCARDRQHRARELHHILRVGRKGAAPLRFLSRSLAEFGQALGIGSGVRGNEVNRERSAPVQEPEYRLRDETWTSQGGFALSQQKAVENVQLNSATVGELQLQVQAVMRAAPGILGRSRSRLFLLEPPPWAEPATPESRRSALEGLQESTSIAVSGSASGGASSAATASLQEMHQELLREEAELLVEAHHLKQKLSSAARTARAAQRAPPCCLLAGAEPGKLLRGGAQSPAGRGGA